MSCVQVEFRPEISKEAADAGLLLWLMKRLKVKVPFDNNKLYASEILSILLQVNLSFRSGDSQENNVSTNIISKL